MHDPRYSLDRGIPRMKGGEVGDFVELEFGELALARGGVGV